MNRTFKINKDPYDKGSKLFKYTKLTLTEGITILTGCNGSGKTTLINEMVYQLKHIYNVPVVYYDNLTKGGFNARDAAFLDKDMQFLVDLMTVSEGQSIALNINKFSSKLQEFILTGKIRDKYSDLADLFARLDNSNGESRESNPAKDSNERWILFDAIDSGLSIDNIIDFKKMIQSVYEYFNAQGYIIFIVVSANMYELVRDQNCIDVTTGKQIDFKDYEDYKKFVMKCRSVIT